jgi:hypothetical protein
VNTSVFFLIVERVVLKCTFSLFLCCVFGIDLNIQLSTTVQLNPTNTINRLKIFYNGIKKKLKTVNVLILTRSRHICYFSLNNGSSFLF